MLQVANLWSNEITVSSKQDEYAPSKKQQNLKHVIFMLPNIHKIMFVYVYMYTFVCGNMYVYIYKHINIICLLSCFIVYYMVN